MSDDLLGFERFAAPAGIEDTPQGRGDGRAN
jgi:hypothetical protein